MKKIYSLFLLPLAILSCDDGNVVVEKVGLQNAPLKKCGSNNLLYKFESNNSLALDLDITTYNTAFSNTLEAKNQIAINNGTAKLIYRTYAGTVTDDNICGSTLNPFPGINEQWEALNGFIAVTTTMNKSINETTQATTITSYRHSLIFKTIGWQKPNGNLQETEDRPFGIHTTPIANILPFGFVKTNLKQITCSATIKILLNLSSNESLELKLNPTTYSALFPAIAVEGIRTALLSATNLFTYKLFNGLVSESYFCTFPTPTIPLDIEKWTVVDDTNAATGVIEVRTTAVGTTEVKHTVILKKVTLEQGTSNFSLGNEYELGSFVAPRL